MRMDINEVHTPFLCDARAPSRCAPFGLRNMTAATNMPRTLMKSTTKLNTAIILVAKMKVMKEARRCDI